ncbi:MAG TPA: hypothetical protein VFT53_07515 [Candidatus Saccharimonadales bacterium]|nr:hypothetical protein [Candidatus Saccharimonadales bacterium]
MSVTEPTSWDSENEDWEAECLAEAVAEAWMFGAEDAGWDD